MNFCYAYIEFFLIFYFKLFDKMFSGIDILKRIQTFNSITWPFAHRKVFSNFSVYG